MNDKVCVILITLALRQAYSLLSLYLHTLIFFFFFGSHCRCLLATLTDMGGLSLYKMINMEWVKQTSVSEQWIEHCQTLWHEENVISLKEQVEELERRATQAKITGELEYSSAKE